MALAKPDIATKLNLNPGQVEKVETIMSGMQDSSRQLFQTAFRNFRGGPGGGGPGGPGGGGPGGGGPGGGGPGGGGQAGPGGGGPGGGGQAAGGPGGGGQGGRGNRNRPPLTEEQKTQMEEQRTNDRGHG